MKNGLKFMLALFVLSLVIISLSRLVKAEDEHEDDERNERSNISVNATHEIEREDGAEREDSHEDWDFSDDFKEPQKNVTANTTVVVPPKNATNATNATAAKEQIKKEEVKEIVEEIEVPIKPLNFSFNESLFNESFDAAWNETMNSTSINTQDLEIPEINMSVYNDSDDDGVIDRDDLYPGQDDKLYIDSDNDGIVDAKDKYPGRNDYDYNDTDMDGVPDSRDSNTHKKTDKDHDGIDDAYDLKDDRSFWIKFLSLFGLSSG